MKQLTGVDATFLYMETSTSVGHVSGLSIFEKPAVEGWSAYEALRRQIEMRLPLLDPLRRRVVEVPFQLDHPFWIRDPDFDLDYHLRETAVAPPGDDRRLEEVVSRIISRPLDRAHPLWEAYVIEGLPDNRFAVLTKVHHATIDGASGAEFMTILFDDTADAIARAEEIADDEWIPEAVPTPLEVLRQELTEVMRKPGKLARLQVRTIRAVGELTRNRGLTGLAEASRQLPNPMGMLSKRPSPDRDEPPEVPDRAAPPTPFNGAITAHRRLAIRSTPLADVKAIKNGLGATVNDVVLAVCSGALRTYLEEHQALPHQPLVAMIPVSIRTGEEEDRWTNRVSAIFTPIPTDVDDPIARIAAVHDAMEIAKDRFSLLPADVITDYAQFAPPALATRAIRMATSLKIGDRMNPPFNLVISNVPGPRAPLYLAGAKLAHYYPVSTIVEGQGLNITVQSYVDRLDFGLLADRDLVPDVDHLADLLVAEIDTLMAATNEIVAAAAEP